MLKRTAHDLRTGGTGTYPKYFLEQDTPGLGDDGPDGIIPAGTQIRCDGFTFKDHNAVVRIIIGWAQASKTYLIPPETPVLIEENPVPEVDLPGDNNW